MHFETAVQLLISFIIGTVIGLEREYRSKAAGLRTMIMISEKKLDELNLYLKSAPQVKAYEY